MQDGTPIDAEGSGVEGAVCGLVKSHCDRKTGRYRTFIDFCNWLEYQVSGSMWEGEHRGLTGQLVWLVRYDGGAAISRVSEL